MQARQKERQGKKKEKQRKGREIVVDIYMITTVEGSIDQIKRAAKLS
jgi:hypothetical protein